MQPKTLYIHIGTHKTGTTALQNFFDLNRTNLRAWDIVYPLDMDGQAKQGHYRLFWSLQVDCGKHSERFPADLRSARKEWTAAIKQCDRQYGLISAEGLWACRSDNIGRIKDMTAAFDVRIIAYLRRQDGLLSSVYNEQIKNGRPLERGKEVTYKMDYRQALGEWAAVFGRQNIIARPYERGQFYDSNIFADFCHYVFGRQLPSEFNLPPKSVNTSLHRIALEYKRLVNRLPLALPQKYEILAPLLRVSEVLDSSGRPDLSVLSPAKRIAVLNECADSNCDVATEYLGRQDGRLFFEPPPDPDEIWQPYESLTQEDAAFINGILLEKFPSAASLLMKSLLEVLASRDLRRDEEFRNLLPGLVSNPANDSQCAAELKQRLSKMFWQANAQSVTTMPRRISRTNVKKTFRRLMGRLVGFWSPRSERVRSPGKKQKPKLKRRPLPAAANKTVYLHVGSPKTGTSALQYFLLHNRDALSRRGFYYPAHALDPNGISSGNAEMLAYFLKNNVSKAEHFISDLLKADVPNIILSSEYLFRLDTACIKQMKRLLANVDTRVIVYLRRQDHMTLAVFHQGIKRHGCTENMEQYLESHRTKNFLYQMRIERWAQCFGKENITVRPYEKQQYVGGDIFTDFLHLLGLELTGDFERPARQINTAYRTDAIEAMRLFNLLPLQSYSQELDAILQHYSDISNRQGDWPYPLLSAAERISILRRHDASNIAIARDYLNRPDGQLFYEPLPDESQPWQPYPGLSGAQLHDIAVHIAQHSGALCSRIAGAVNKGLRSADPAVRQAAETLSGAAQLFAAADNVPQTCLLAPNRGPGFLRRAYYCLPVRLREPLKYALRYTARRLKGALKSPRT